MRASAAARRSRQTGVGDIEEGSAGIVSIRPRSRIVEKLRAVELSIELKRLGRYVALIVTAEQPPT